VAMPAERLRVPLGQVLNLAEKQHGVVSRAQLAELGMGDAAIRHSLERGRLHRLMPGIYAVGRPGVTERGRWMAAVLACGPSALLSHRCAAALLGLRRPPRGPVEIVVPAHVVRRRPGIRVYRRAGWKAGGGELKPLRPRLVDHIPVTGPAVTLVDLATCLATGELEAAVNEADHLNRVDPETLRSAVDALGRRPGARRLRVLLDSTSLALTATALERLFRPLAEDAGLPAPQTQAQLGSHRVDFYWAELGLIVEADSLRYHRTPFKQAADKRRDNAHAGSGLTTLRFTHWQMQREPGYVREELRTVARRLAAERTAPAA
jgi:very-short-patch-repair endonuclease